MAEEQGPWERLAEAVVARRNARGWTQVEVANRGGLSLDRLQAIEGVRATSYRPKTMEALERGLDWTRGSVARVLAGDEPEEIEKRRDDYGENDLLVLLERIANEVPPMPLVNTVMKRQEALGLLDSELVERTLAGVDRRSAIFGRPSRDGLRRSLEKVLQFPPGAIKNFLLAGDEWDDDRLDDLGGERSLWLGEEVHPVAPGEVLHSEAMTIARSGLPQDVQDDLIQYVAHRRREFNLSLTDDLDVLIELTKRAHGSESRTS